VTVYVGDVKNEFHIHQNLLCGASTFFDAAFTSKFKEGSEKKMTLPEDDPEVFEAFVQWLYHQYYEIPASDLRHEQARYLSQTMQLFILADKHGVAKLKNGIIDALVRNAQSKRTPPSRFAIHQIYEFTPPGSGIRVLLADWYACQAPPSWLQEPTTNTWLRERPDFAADMVAAMARFETNSQKNDYFKSLSSGLKYHKDREGFGTESS